jgi:hypothetical protein
VRVEVHTIGASEAAKGLTDAAATIPLRLAALTAHYAQVGALYAQRLAPRKTGHYATTIEADATGFGSDAPQAHRLEVGFHGADSLGRVYNQGPRPHFGPAADAAGAEFWAAVDAFMDEL